MLDSGAHRGTLAATLLMTDDTQLWTVSLASPERMQCAVTAAIVDVYQLEVDLAIQCLPDLIDQQLDVFLFILYRYDYRKIWHS